MINKNLVNFNEHSFNVKYEDHFWNNRPTIMYGYLHEITVNETEYADGFEIENMSVTVDMTDGSTDESINTAQVVCGWGKKWERILTIGNFSLDLSFYTKDQVLKILKEKLGK